MKIKYLLTAALLIGSTSCINKEMSNNLRHSYSTHEKIGMANIEFQTLRDLKHGAACSYNLFYIIPFGNTSIFFAAEEGAVNKISYIGESGFWSFPFSKTCTEVFGS